MEDEGLILNTVAYTYTPTGNLTYLRFADKDGQFIPFLEWNNEIAKMTPINTTSYALNGDIYNNTKYRILKPDYYLKMFYAKHKDDENDNIKIISISKNIDDLPECIIYFQNSIDDMIILYRNTLISNNFNAIIEKYEIVDRFIMAGYNINTIARQISYIVNKTETKLNKFIDTYIGGMDKFDAIATVLDNVIDTILEIKDVNIGLISAAEWKRNRLLDIFAFNSQIQILDVEEYTKEINLNKIQECFMLLRDTSSNIVYVVLYRSIGDNV